MKKIIALSAALSLMLTCFVPAVAEGGKISVVTTIFPIYDWVREIVGGNENAEITLLLDSGVDLHSYRPTVQDIVKVSTGDVFIYVGGESDDWVDGVLAEAVNQDMKVVNLVEAMGEDIKPEEIVEGMEHEHGHEHEEIEPEDIRDRSLTEFAGEWRSPVPAAESGELDPFFAHEAEEEGSTPEEVRAEHIAGWACGVTAIGIDGDSITFTAADGSACTASYTYAGFTPVTAQDGDITAVRYQFTADSGDAPKYVQFNDHGHEPGKAEHFHVYFGNESFEALMSAESDPFFVPADLSAAGIMSELASHGHEHQDHEHEEEEMDEHVWLSLRNAQKLAAVITSALCEADPGNASAYRANADAYIAGLADLDARYAEVVGSAACRTVLFGDRFPFRYLADDYGLTYYAAFSGCSAESEASFATIVFLARKVDELQLPAVLTIEDPKFRIAETIVANTLNKDQKILSLDSMQGTTAADIAAGMTYLSVMESNLAILEDALN